MGDRDLNKKSINFIFYKYLSIGITLIIFSVISFFLLLGSMLPIKSQKLYLIVSFVILFNLMAYRSTSVGTDTLNYEIIFNNLEDGHDWVRPLIEPGWVAINDLVIFLGGSFREVLKLSSFLILMPVFFISYTYSSNPMLSIFLYYNLYFYFYAFNITRQLVAASFALFSIMFLIRKKRILFFIFLLIACLFHYSAITLLPLVLINKLPEQNYKLILVVFISMFIGIFSPQYLFGLVGKIGYSHYLTEYTLGNVFGNFLNLTIINSLFVFILLTIRSKNIEFKIFFIIIVLMNLMARIPFGNRVILNFSVFQILFYPYYLAFLKNRGVNYKITAIAIIVVFAFITFFTSLGKGGILPYTNILF